VQGEVIYNHDGKVQALKNFFRSVIGQPGSSSWSFINSIFQDQHQPSAQLTAPSLSKKRLQL